MKRSLKLLALLLALVMVAALLPTSALAEGQHTENKETTGVTTDAETTPPNGYVRTPEHGTRAVSDAYARGDMETYYRLKGVEPTRDPLPTFYDSNVNGYVTSVKNQNPYGSCWAHAAMACVESYMIKHGVEVGSTGSAATTNLNLSETQHCFYNYSAAYDEEGMLTGDKCTLLGTDTCLDAGGNGELSAYTLQRWCGAADESVNALAYNNAGTVAYSGLSSQYAYDYDVSHVQNSEWIPGTDIEGVKRAIMEYGAGNISYYETGNEYTYICTIDNSSQDSSSHKWANHAITVVGWDDSISADSFTPNRPSSNGAWICKNSWGTGSFDDGYCYISYEDTTVLEGYIYFYDAEPVGNYDHNYQYDGSCNPVTYGVGNRVGFLNNTKVANVFTATGSQMLKAVALCSWDEALSYTVEIYKNPTAGAPTSGDLMSTQSGTLAYCGYYTIVLDTPVVLNTGDTFSVVFTQTVPYGEIHTPYDASFQDTSLVEWASWTHADHGDTSYYKEPNGSWTDCPDNGDYRIKAYTVDYEIPYTVTAVSNNDSYGTVSVAGKVITATPADGYYVESADVISGTATVSVNVNTITVTPESDCTVRVNFAPKPIYTVNFVAVGNAEGSATAYIYDEITLPGSVSVSVNGWTFVGWIAAEVADTTDEPAFYAPGASYTVTANATLYALYTRTEEGAGGLVYELVTEAPIGGDWSGNYVISSGETDSMYVLKGVTVSNSNQDIESNNNASAFADSGITLLNDVLSDVDYEYVFTLTKEGNYHTVRSLWTGTYIGIKNSFLTGFADYDSAYCNWTPVINGSHAVRLENAVGGSYSYLGLYGSDYYGATSSSSSKADLRLWKETSGDALYYSTAPHAHTYGEWTPNNDGTHSKTCSGCGDVITEYCTFSDVVTEPTATEQGYTTHTCTVCGYSYVDSYVAPYIHTVTAVSNNDAWGSVSVSNYTITATPAAGYYLSGCEVTSGTAATTVDGNIITVTPESDCTVTVNFAPIPTYTVRFVAIGYSEGSQTANEGDEITLPSSVSVSVDDWTFVGWADAELAETAAAPAYYAPGESYTVTANATLYALYTRTEGEGLTFYELVTEAPSDWSGNYVISNGETSGMYVLKGVAVNSGNTDAENSNNCSTFANSGITLTDNKLYDVANDYVMTLAAQGSYYTLYNDAVGSYYGMNSSSYLNVYADYNATYCNWTPGINDSHGVSLKNAANGSYPYLSFTVNNNYFWSGSSNSANVLRLWKEVGGSKTYYSTSPVAPHVHTYGEWTSNDNGTHSHTCSGCGDVVTEDCTYDDVVTEPTTTEQGYTTHTCTVCGYSYVDSYVAPYTYTVTAVSNNDAWGTVSVRNYTITVTPAAGYRLSGYEITSGTATAAVSGNTITVTPESDCTVTVIFEAIPTYTVTYISVGAQEGSATAHIGDVINLPMSVGNEPDDWTLCGWVETRIDETTQKPAGTYVLGAEYTVTGDATLYALFTRVDLGIGEAGYQLTDELAVGGKYVIVWEDVDGYGVGNYAVGNTILDSSTNHYLNAQSVTTDDATGMLTVPSGVNTEALLYEIVSGSDSAGWVFRNVENDLYLSLTEDEYLTLRGDRPLAWAYVYDNGLGYYGLDNQVDSEGYYYLSLDTTNIRFTTNKMAKSIKMYQEINPDVDYYTTDPALDGFYLIGPDWTVDAIDAAEKFAANPNASGEYMLNTRLAVGDKIKAVKVVDGAITVWYPDGMDNEYTVDAAHAGDVTVYFRETYNNDWSAFGGYIYIASSKPSFVTQSLTLGSEIGVSFYVNLNSLSNDERTASKMTFTVSGRGANDLETKEVAFDSANTKATGVYYFTCRINALQMADTITATFHYGDVETIEKTYSVKEYIEKWDELYEAGKTGLSGEELTNTTSLIQALADYGHYVQPFLAGVHGFEIGSGDDKYAEMDAFYAEGYDPTQLDPDDYPMTVDPDPDYVVVDDPVFGSPTMSLVLDSETAIRIYFNRFDDSVAFDEGFNVTVKWDDGTESGKTLTLDEDYTVTKVGNRYMVQINGVKASRLLDLFTITAKNGTDETAATQTVDVYAVSYVGRLLNSATWGGNADAQNAVCALWAYAQAAANY